MAVLHDPVEQHLMVLDPMKALRGVIPDIDRAARLDPKVAEARDLLVERVSGVLSADDDDILLPSLGLRFRQEFDRPSRLQVLRLALQDGDFVLRTVEDALATTFSHDVLARAIREAGGGADSAPPHAQRLERARAEARAFTEVLPQDNPAALGAAVILVGIGVAAGIGIGVAVSEIAHHHHHTLRP